MVPHSFCDYMVWNDNVFKGKSVDVTQLFSFSEVLIGVVVQGQIPVYIYFHCRHCLGSVALCTMKRDGSAGGIGAILRGDKD
ncbi:hypothetical protein V6N11_053263 [Hibiscus sabdariffa]|uniref:Uncharacterized protein n=1 Tax=Hibiscus sabdariffa TaxID=183260 RepID=A0ABR2UCR6_9ROSI